MEPWIERVGIVALPFVPLPHKWGESRSTIVALVLRIHRSAPAKIRWGGPQESCDRPFTCISARRLLKGHAERCGMR